MNIIITDTYEQLSKHAAQIIAQKITANPSLIVGLATGSTPIGLYQELIAQAHQKKLDLCQVTTFNLDEYVGLAPEHPHSYHFFMRKNLFDRVSIKKDNIFIPSGLAPDLEQECLAYETAIKKHGGIDVQVLGIGRDGHVGFNEPGSSITSRTRVVPLDPVTIRDNARFFQNDSTQVPTHAITMGIATILESREIILLANGAHKADIVYQALRGPVTNQVPASFLQQHPQVTVILDQAAAATLLAPS